VASTVSSSPGIFFGNSSPRVPKRSLDAISSKPDAQMASATEYRRVPFAHVSSPRRDKVEKDTPALKESAASSELPSSLGFSNSQTSLFQQPATLASHGLDGTEEPSLRASELLAESQLEDRPFTRNGTHNITVDARGKTSSLNHKRLFQDAEPEPCPPADGLVDAPPKKTKAIVQPRKSLARASIAPLPTLPILDVVKKLTDKKQVSEDIEPAPQSQVDEDEILLSAARIAAESLKNGPSLLDEMRSYSSSLLNGSSYYSSSVFGKSLSSAGNKDQTSWPYARIHGHNVALAPDGPLGLGRTMSRTEQRIRSTGGKGLAYKPLDLSSGKAPPKGKAPR
jgi:nuclear mRNA export protein SAC3